jgi:hypothetical protein
MDKYLLSNNCFKPFNLEENNSKKRPPKNILGNSEKFIKMTTQFQEAKKN